MQKKDYTAPKITKVNLNLKNAILAVCHSSPLALSPKEAPVNDCRFATGCYNPPV